MDQLDLSTWCGWILILLSRRNITEILWQKPDSIVASVDWKNGRMELNIR